MKKIIPRLPLLIVELKHNFEVEKHVNQIQTNFNKFDMKKLPNLNILKSEMSEQIPFKMTMHQLIIVNILY